MRGLRPAAVLVRHEIRKRHRLAELLAAVGERGRDIDGQFLLHDADRGALPPLWRPSRARVRRRSEADWPALLHEWRRDEIRAGGVWRAGVVLMVRSAAKLLVSNHGAELGTILRGSLRSRLRM